MPPTCLTAYDPKSRCGRCAADRVYSLRPLLEHIMRVALISIGNCPSLALRNIKTYCMAHEDVADSVSFRICDYDIREIRDARTQSARQCTTKATGSDGSGSGIDTIQFSGNGTTWSSPVTYNPAGHSVNLSNFGGNPNEGTKTSWVRLIDLAGNVSSSASDTIVYDNGNPTITSVERPGAIWYAALRMPKRSGTLQNSIRGSATLSLLGTRR